MVTMSLSRAVKLIGLYTILNYTCTPHSPDQHALSHTSVPEPTVCPRFPWLAGAKDQSSAAAANDQQVGSFET